jgi:hypothetical protein
MLLRGTGLCELARLCCIMYLSSTVVGFLNSDALSLPIASGDFGLLLPVSPHLDCSSDQ